jgi:hypothetical protein
MMTHRYDPVECCCEYCEKRYQRELRAYKERIRLKATSQNQLEGK